MFFTIYHKLLRLSGTVLLLQCAACTKNILNPTPTTTISNATAYSTPAKILANVNSLYSQLENQYFFGGGFIVYNEQRADEFSQNDGNNSTGANVWNETITSSGSFVNYVWNAAYATINSANILLANLANTTVISDSLATNYGAEAKFVRAFCYFNLVEMYAPPYAQSPNAAGLPLRLKAETTGGDNNLSFSTVSQVYAQITQDLTDAVNGLPTGYGTALLTVSRATRGAAIALLTRVYLSKGDYDSVMTEAGAIVSATAPYHYTAGTVTHQLESNIATVFSGTYTGAEAMFSLPFVNPSETPGTQSALAYNYLYPILYMNTAGILGNPAFSPTSTDARARSLTTTNANGQHLLKKFSKNSVPYSDYIPAIRYAEVLLNYAEAAANKGNLGQAAALLEAVRWRSDPTYVFPPDSLASSASLVNAILTERRIELLGEGFRNADLHRLVMTLPGKTGTAGTAPAVSPTDANYVWPVPSGELSYNRLAP